MSQATRNAPNATKPSGIPWLGDIPSHWEVKRLRFLVEKIGSGKTPKGGGESYPLEGIIFIRSQNVYDDGLRLDDVVFINEEMDEVMSSTRVKPNDVLLNITGASIGRSARVPEDLGPANVNQHVAIVRPVRKVLDQGFLHAFLCSQATKAAILADEVGSSREALNSHQISALTLPLPPLPEQRSIAAFLDERTARIDGLIARKQRLVALLREKRQALITRAVTRGLDPKVKLKESGVPWLGAVPEGWDVVRLKKIAIKITKGTTPTTEGGGFVDEGEIRFIKVESIGDRMNIIDEMCARIDEAMNTALSRSQLQESDVLVSIAGAIGRIGLVPKSALPANTNQAVGIVRVNKSIALPEWVALALQCHAAQEQFALDNVQSAQANLSLGDLGNTWITLPPMIQQQVIIATVNQQTTRIDALIAKVEAAVERLVEYRVALISAAVTGKVRVP
jgi:type I restriction enzyme S subunit